MGEISRSDERKMIVYVMFLVFFLKMESLVFESSAIVFFVYIYTEDIAEVFYGRKHRLSR